MSILGALSLIVAGPCVINEIVIPDSQLHRYGVIGVGQVGLCRLQTGGDMLQIVIGTMGGVVTRRQGLQKCIRRCGRDPGFFTQRKPERLQVSHKTPFSQDRRVTLSARDQELDAAASRSFTRS